MATLRQLVTEHQGAAERRSALLRRSGSSAFGDPSSTCDLHAPRAGRAPRLARRAGLPAQFAAAAGLRQTRARPSSPIFAIKTGRRRTALVRRSGSSPGDGGDASDRHRPTPFGSPAARRRVSGVRRRGRDSGMWELVGVGRRVDDAGQAGAGGAGRRYLPARVARWLCWRDGGLGLWRCEWRAVAAHGGARRGCPSRRTGLVLLDKAGAAYLMFWDVHGGRRGEVSAAAT